MGSSLHVSLLSDLLVQDHSDHSQCLLIHSAALYFLSDGLLLTPFKDNGHLTVSQSSYNTKLSETRQVVERSLGLLKGRWRRIICLEMEDTEEVPYVISAARSLHNFCLFADDGDFEQFFAEDDDDDDDDDNDDDSDSELSQPQATAKRNLMVQYLQHL